jgi:hypothetical protein
MINAEPGVRARRTQTGMAQGVVQRRALPAHFDTLPRKYRYAPVTRQMTLPTSSATSSERSGPSVTPTGRP